MNESADSVDNLRNLLETMVRELVDEPDGVRISVTASEGGNCVALSVKTAEGEVGKVIGKSGRNARALRTIVEAAAAKYRLRIMLDIEDDVGRR
jgi:predicted RNA-binding protein YlqC (UPF0109 family)